MGVDNIDRMLPANRMVFEIRRDTLKYQRFRQNMEPVMEEYGLTEVEKQAFRNQDIKKLSELGLHPYFLPQVSRLIHGAAYNHNRSEAAKLYARNMVPGADQDG